MSRFASFAWAFIPFGLLMAAGNLYAEIAPNVLHRRTTVTAWITFAFAIPAIAIFLLYHLQKAPAGIYRAWQLAWSFGFLAYAIHTAWATYGWYDFNFRQIVARQEWLPVIANYLLLLLWAIDVADSWRGQGVRRGATLGVIHWAAHLLFIAAGFTATIVFHANKTPVSLVLGILLCLVVLPTALARLIWGDFGRPRPSSESLQGPFARL